MSTESQALDAAGPAGPAQEPLPPVAPPGGEATGPAPEAPGERCSPAGAEAGAQADPALGDGQAGGGEAALLAEISRAVHELAEATDRYHARAEQRESVIDHLHAETDRLRRGERRGLLRPLLVEMCRLRNDLLRQASDLPADFNADRARVLLCSFADSVELALEESGVVTFAPQPGDPFEPRMHRRVGGEPSANPALAGHVARVQRAGYLDIDASSPNKPAEVVLYAAAPALPAQSTSTPGTNPPAQQMDPAGAGQLPAPAPPSPLAGDERTRL
jgi:molecular chaperone GrpE